jgi:hypothetical protein
MQIRKTVATLAFLIFFKCSYAQTTFLPQDARENVLLERLEIKAMRDSILNFSKTKPFSRRQYVPAIDKYYRAGLNLRNSAITDTAEEGAAEINAVGARLTRVDLYNARMAFLNSLEWARGTREEYASKKPFWKHFWKTPATFYEVHDPNFFLAVNPVFQYTVGKEQAQDQHLFLNTRGVSLRGRIANKIGFDAYLTDNQERDPLYVQRWEKRFKSVPGEGYYKYFKKGGYDYFDARGSVTFGVTPYIDVQFGYDKNFIGNGYRSLFLSDFSNNALFVKLQTRIWKFNYQNLFMELNATEPRGGDRLLAHKYAALHHLDVAVTKWLNIGLFEGIVFARKDHFEFGYLNPVIFYRSVEQQNGSADNAVAGLDFKANVAHHFQFYGQLLLDEFKLSEIKAGKGWWANKYALQLGAKYIDAFGIRNLDLQTEITQVRPFTYSHDDSVANYTHYNQPLAHPLGANFSEWIGLARYQPAPRWMVLAKALYYMQGRDVDSANYGSNIFLPNNPPYRTKEYGFEIGSGVRTKTAITSLLLSYELRPNLFIEGNLLYRKETSASPLLPSGNTVTISAGVRWNMHRRTFDF